MDLEERPSVDKDTAKFVGFELEKKVVIQKDDEEKKVFVGGRLIEPEEQERVLEVLAGLKAYIKVKMANNFFAAKEEDKEQNHQDPNTKRKHHHHEAPNPLSAHQSQRQEIASFWNKFSMIQIVKKQGKKRKETQPAKAPPQIPKGGGNLLDGLKNELAQEDRHAPDDEERIIRVMNSKGKLVPIRFDQVKQSLKDLQKLNAIPSNRDDDEASSNRKDKKNLNPIICLRTLVSQKKNRLKIDGFNLDLTYINNYVIALGYPAAGVDIAIRNNREDVIKFLKMRHGINVKIYNLCIEKSKQYDQSEIPEFGYGKYCFSDHNICSIRTCFNICMDIFLFLQQMLQQKSDIINCLANHYHGNNFSQQELKIIEDDFLKDPVVAIHCKAGKGRTGLVIVCYLLYTEMFDNVEDAIAHYDETRTQNKKALTIHSQIRQVYHFKHFLDRNCTDNSRGFKKNYILNSIKNYKVCMAELDMMENCEEYQYKNSLNIFSLTLGPFEKAPDKMIKQPIEAENASIKVGKSKNEAQSSNGDDDESLIMDAGFATSHNHTTKKTNKMQTHHDSFEQENDADEFIESINENEFLKLQFFKLRPDGNTELIWDLHDFLEYNKDKTGQLIKSIEIQKYAYSTKEQYVIIMLEKILEEFTEPHFGYIRINVAIKPINLNKLTIDEKVKFYFWINVAGVCTMQDPQSGQIPSIFDSYRYVVANPRTANGFKLMNDQNEMMKLILPQVVNQGEAEHKAIEEAEARRIQAEQREKMMAEQAEGEAEPSEEQIEEKQEQQQEEEEEQPIEEEKVEVEDQPKKFDMMAALQKGLKKNVVSLKKKGGKNRGVLAQMQLLDSIVSITDDFFSAEANSLSVPKNYMNFVNPYDIKQDIEPDHQRMEINYQEQLQELWLNLQNKVIEKISDSRMIMIDELRQIQGRHRQFYKIQFDKIQLDKYQPAKEVKIQTEWVQKQKKQKKVKKNEKPEKPPMKMQLANFCMTLLLYEDSN